MPEYFSSSLDHICLAAGGREEAQGSGLGQEQSQRCLGIQRFEEGNIQAEPTEHAGLHCELQSFKPISSSTPNPQAMPWVLLCANEA